MSDKHPYFCFACAPKRGIDYNTQPGKVAGVMLSCQVCGGHTYINKPGALQKILEKKRGRLTNA